MLRSEQTVVPANEFGRRMEGQTSPLDPNLIRKFTPDAMRARPGGEFSPKRTLEILRQNTHECVAIDIGGTKMSIAKVKFINGLPEIGTVETITTKNSGADFLDRLKELADEFPGNIAISIAGEVKSDGKTFGPLPNLRGLTKALGDKNDFITLFGERYSLANDAECGLKAVATACVASKIEQPNVVFVIDGTGIGAATLNIADGQITQLEPGHIEGDPAVNPYGYEQACDPESERFHTCLERLAGWGSGAVAQWNQLYPNQTVTSGRELMEKVLAGNTDAINLFMLSTQIVATIAAGIITANELNTAKTVLVFGGGASQIVGRVERIDRTLASHFGSTRPLVMSALDLGILNPSLYGAAILAGIM